MNEFEIEIITAQALALKEQDVDCSFKLLAEVLS
jgi:hypothetical protein